MTAALGGVPVIGDLARSAETQAKWMQEVLDQNARLVGQLPATMKSFNDSLERFNQTISRLDRAVTRLEQTSRALTGPLERVSAAIDPQALRDLPETLESLRREALPALRAATDTQRQVTLIQSTLERVVTALGDLPGAGLVRRLTTPRDTPPAESPTVRDAGTQGTGVGSPPRSRRPRQR